MRPEHCNKPMLKKGKNRYGNQVYLCAVCLKSKTIKEVER